MLRFRSYIMLVEDRVDFVKKQNPNIDTSHDTNVAHTSQLYYGRKAWKDHSPEEKSHAVIDHLAASHDPTPKKEYTQWLTGQYKKKNIRLEDHPRVNATLKDFHQHKQRLEKKDINQYKHISDVEAAVAPHVGTVSNKEQKRVVKHEGADLIHTGDTGVTIHRLKTKEAAQHYGKGTKWCTAAENHSMFDHYHKQGPLHVIQAKVDGEHRKYQYHEHSDQFMDEKDRDVGSVHGRQLIDAHPSLVHEPTFQKFAARIAPHKLVDHSGTLSSDAQHAIVKNARWTSSSQAEAHETVKKLVKRHDFDIGASGPAVHEALGHVNHYRVQKDLPQVPELANHVMNNPHLMHDSMKNYGHGIAANAGRSHQHIVVSHGSPEQIKSALSSGHIAHFHLDGKAAPQSSDVAYAALTHPDKGVRDHAHQVLGKKASNGAKVYYGSHADNQELIKDHDLEERHVSRIAGMLNGMPNTEQKRTFSLNLIAHPNAGKAIAKHAGFLHPDTIKHAMASPHMSDEGLQHIMTHAFDHHKAAHDALEHPAAGSDVLHHVAYRLGHNAELLHKAVTHPAATASVHANALRHSDAPELYSGTPGHVIDTHIKIAQHIVDHGHKVPLDTHMDTVKQAGEVLQQLHAHKQGKNK